MSKLALYRKYRPNDFNNVYGQSVIIKTLINSILLNKITHSYIFSGPKGSGKTSIAKIFSKAINCLNNTNGNPCDQCTNCVAIKNMDTVDILELDAASNSGVAEIRSIIDSVSYQPSMLKYKVYIIDEAHMLTTNSWNAFLKTLEEPPPNVIFLFATTEYNKIPSTIVSRCQRYDFNKISDNDLTSLVNKVCESENIKIDKESLDAIVSLANGAARDALSILDQISNYSNDNVTFSDLSNVFGIINIQNKINLINFILNKNIQEIIILINEYEKSGVNLYILMYELIEIFMEKIIYLQTNNQILLKKLNIENVNKINSTNVSVMLEIIKILNDNLLKIKTNSNPRFYFEFTLLKAIDFNNTNQQQNISHITKVVTTPEVVVVKPEIKVIEQTVEEDNLSPPDLTSNMFNTNERKTIIETIEPKKAAETLITEQTTNDISLKESKPKKILMSDKEIEECFIAIAANYNKEMKVQFNSLLEELKEKKVMFSGLILNALHAKLFLLTSNNGAVLLFGTETSANKFNEISETKEFRDWYLNNFNKEQKVIGISKEKAVQLSEIFKNHAKDNIKDVKINNNNDITNTLLDILNDKD